MVGGELHHSIRGREALLIIITKDGQVLEFEPFQWAAIRILIGDGDNIAYMFCTLSRSSIAYLATCLDAIHQLEERKHNHG